MLKKMSFLAVYLFSVLAHPCKQPLPIKIPSGEQAEVIVCQEKDCKHNVGPVYRIEIDGKKRFGHLWWDRDQKMQIHLNK